MGLLILAFPVLEIWGLFFFGARIGFVNTHFWLIAAGVLGFGVIRAQGVYLIANVQATLAKGQLPTQPIINSLLMFLGGVMFVIPGFFSDFVGLMLVLPGTRHLIAKIMSAKIQAKMKNGSFRMASFGGFGGMGGFGGGFGSGPTAGRDVTPRQIGRQSRDVEVIDVTPIKPSDNEGKD